MNSEVGGRYLPTFTIKRQAFLTKSEVLVILTAIRDIAAEVETIMNLTIKLLSDADVA